MFFAMFPILRPVYGLDNVWVLCVMYDGLVDFTTHSPINDEL